MAGKSAGEARDSKGVRVVLPAALWQDKILQNHPELGSHLADVLRAITEPITSFPIRSTRAVVAITCAELVLVDGCWWS
jgi:hypothetical protein